MPSESRILVSLPLSIHSWARAMHTALVGDGPELSDLRRAGRYRWFVVALVFLVVLVLFLHRINLSVAIIPWAEECHWTEAQQQAQLGAFFW